jgi:hypothetical protein
MTTLVIGPNPQDDPTIRSDIDAGLSAFLQIHLDRQQPSRPVGRAFPNLPAGRMPNTATHHSPPGWWTPPQPGPEPHSPRR